MAHKRILLVDDEESILTSLDMEFKHAGYDVTLPDKGSIFTITLPIKGVKNTE